MREQIASRRSLTERIFLDGLEGVDSRCHSVFFKCEWQPSFLKKQNVASDRVKAPRPNAVDWAKVVHHALALSFPESETSALTQLGSSSRKNARIHVHNTATAVQTCLSI